MKKHKKAVIFIGLALVFFLMLYFGVDTNQGFNQ